MCLLLLIQFPYNIPPFGIVDVLHTQPHEFEPKCSVLLIAASALYAGAFREGQTSIGLLNKAKANKGLRDDPGDLLNGCLQHRSQPLTDFQ
jgi:hypothetical protein